MTRHLPAARSLLAVRAACEPKPAAAGQAFAKAAPVHVDTVVVTERQMPRTVLLAGSLKAFEESDLAANANGRVLKTMVERGSLVAKGAAIAQLDTRFSALAAIEAKANLEAAGEQKKLAQNDSARSGFPRMRRRIRFSQMRRTWPA